VIGQLAKWKLMLGRGHEPEQNVQATLAQPMFLAHGHQLTGHSGGHAQRRHASTVRISLSDSGRRDSRSA